MSWEKTHIEYNVSNQQSICVNVEIFHECNIVGWKNILFKCCKVVKSSEFIPLSGTHFILLLDYNGHHTIIWYIHTSTFH